MACSGLSESQYITCHTVSLESWNLKTSYFIGCLLFYPHTQCRQQKKNVTFQVLKNKISEFSLPN